LSELKWIFKKVKYRTSYVKLFGDEICQIFAVALKSIIACQILSGLGAPHHDVRLLLKSKSKFEINTLKN
jgi:hypothetical protein